MQNRTWLKLLIISWCLLSQLAFAASFNAQVDSNSISFGQSVQLKLRLEDAKALAPLDASAVAQDFLIYNQQQFSSYKNINGNVTAEIGWNLTLMPKKEGEFVIPPIAIDTDKGKLSTQAIKISVRHPKPGDKTADDAGTGISLLTNVSKNKAYVNEPVIYTVKIVSYKPIANIVLEDIKSSDAIVEKIGDPKQYNQTHGGVAAHIIEVRYAITPLREGKVKIAPALMHGEIQVPAQQQRRPSRFGLFNDIFLDNMVELKPFSMQSEEITIDAQAAPIKTKDWLPLRGLSISEKWDGVQDAKVGETITRKIKIVAKGAFAKQLPSVKDFVEATNLKTYANKPTFTDNYDQDANTMVGTREEEYSIVPQQDGNITFPEVKISWWNLKTNKLEVSTLPAKTIHVAAVIGASNPSVTIDYGNQGKPQEIQIQEQTTADQNSVYLYVIIGVLAGVILTGLLGLMLFIIYGKVANRNKKTTIKKSKQKTKQEIEINTVADLREYIMQYAVKNWHITAGTTLNRLGDALHSNNYVFDIELYADLSKELNASLYARAQVELTLLQQQWEEFRKTVHKSKTGNKRKIANEEETSLNPT